MANYKNDELAIAYLDYLGVSRKKISDLLLKTKSIYNELKSMSAEIQNILGKAKIEKLNSLGIDVSLKNLQDYLNSEEIKLTTIESEDFPSKLTEIPDAPVVLYYRGDLSIIGNAVLLGVVGTRKPSHYGKWVVQKFLNELIDGERIITVSGLAYGIDSEVARGTLENNGKTIAVLGGGLKNIYPSSNISLAEKIINSGGLIISEYFPTVKPAQYTFPERNRIISGLSDGVLVVEAGFKSGSLITANFAIEQGRELFVVPGDINNVNNLGSNKLIEELPHTFTSSAETILKAFNLVSEEKINKQMQLSFEQERVVSALETGEKHIEELCEILKEDYQNLNLLLTEMEISGIIKKLAGDYYSRI